jgi:hypothetical protein
MMWLGFMFMDMKELGNGEAMEDSDAFVTVNLV